MTDRQTGGIIGKFDFQQGSKLINWIAVRINQGYGSSGSGFDPSRFGSRPVARQKLPLFHSIIKMHNGSRPLKAKSLFHLRVLFWSRTCRRRCRRCRPWRRNGPVDLSQPTTSSPLRFNKYFTNLSMQQCGPKVILWRDIFNYISLYMREPISSTLLTTLPRSRKNVTVKPNWLYSILLQNKV